MKNVIYFIIVYQLFFQAIAGMIFEGVPVIRVLIDFFIYAIAISALLTIKINLNKLLLPYLILLMVVILSYIVNQSELTTFIKQIRFTFIGLVVWILIKNSGFTRKEYDKLLNIFFSIGYIQLPIVVFQLIMFDSGYLKNTPGDYVDAGTGTVGFMDSGVTGMYLVILLIVKFQKFFASSVTMLDVLKIILLGAPLGLINSDAQFVFLPIIFLFTLYLNFKLNKKVLIYVFSLVVVTLIANQLLMVNWSGDRDIFKYVSSKVYHLVNTEPNYNSEQLRMLRYDSMRYVIDHTDHDDWLIGKGSGYWLNRDSEGGDSSITNVWYHANTLLLSYGELGVIGLIAYILFPLTLCFYADNSFWGKILKIESLYIFLLLFYHHPLNKLSIVIVLATLIAIYSAEKNSTAVRFEKRRNNARLL